LAVGNQADAQVTVTEVDSLLNPIMDETEAYALDLNNDGTVDFIIEAVNGSYKWASFRPAPGAEFAFTSIYASGESTMYKNVALFEAGDIINDQLDFLTSSGSIGYWGPFYSLGPFNEEKEGDKFAGVRITLDGGTSYNYGWVRIESDTAYENVKIVDYGFEATANKEIAAGALHSVSVKDQLKARTAQVYSADNRIIIADLKRDRAVAEIFSSTGQLIRSLDVKSGWNEVQMETKGLYFVRLKDGDEMLETSKVVVK